MGCGGETSFISIFEYSNKLEIGDGGSVGLQKNHKKESKRGKEGEGDGDGDGVTP